MAKRKRTDKKGARKRTMKRQAMAYKVDFKRLGLPKFQSVRLRYIDRLSFIATLASSTHQFRANSLYDPDLTATLNHQPRFRDQWAAMYHHYVVTASKINVTFTRVGSSGTGSAYPNVVGIVLKSDSGIHSNILDYAEEQNSVYGMLNDANSKLTLSKTFDTASYYNVKPSAVMSDTRFVTSVNNNPTEDVLFTVFNGSIDGTNTVPALECIVQIEYTCRFIEPKDPGAS